MNNGKLVVTIGNAMLTAGNEKLKEMFKEIPQEDLTDNYLSAIVLSAGVMVLTQLAKNSARLNKLSYKEQLAMAISEIIKVEGLE